MAQRPSSKTARSPDPDQSASPLTSRVFTGGPHPDHQLQAALSDAFASASSIDLAVSFLMESGVRLMLPALQQAAQKGTPIRILCGSYLNITQPAALSLLQSTLQESAALYFYNEPTRSFHPKAYLFQMEDHRQLFIGSSNMSASALTSGIEWNYRLTDATDAASIDAFQDEFNDLLAHHALRIDEERIQAYSRTWKRPRVYLDLEEQPAPPADPSSETPAEVLVPRGPQIEALLALEQTRREGAHRALVQAATGVGKTYLAAFDSRDFQRVLFVAHRQEILEQAAASFTRVRPDASIGFFDARRKDTTADLVFASIQTIGQAAHLHQYFQPADFDYLVVDEFHHAAADSYQRLLAYFEPQFLLGLTATPERTDDRSIYEICDFNVPFQMDLQTAINQGVLSPFHYYGIYDSTDYSHIEYRQGRYSPKALFQAYQKAPQRLELILKHYRKHSRSTALGFCSSQEHALQMAEFFNQRGIPSGALISSSSDHPCSLPRTTALRQLEEGVLRVLFCVDMLNEGVDIPAIDLVMFLRPTESSIVFLQQLGRGLRKAPGKDHLTVLDFIGNYKNAGKVPALLSGALPASIASAPSPAFYPETRLPLPAGCLADFDLQLLDLFEHMRRQNQNKRQRIEQEYRRIQDLLQRVPSRMDLFLYMEEDLYTLCMETPKENPFRDYLTYRHRHQDLSQEQQHLFAGKAREFLHLLETTSMTKVYKMPVLMAFDQQDHIASRVSRDDLLKSWTAFFAVNSNWKDLPQVHSFEEFQAISAQKHWTTILNNPVHFLVQSGHGWLIQEDDWPLALHPDLAPYLDQPAFVEEYRDIIRFRQMDYYRRRFQNKQNAPVLQA